MGLPFKEDEDFRKHNQKAQEGAAEELQRFIEATESDDEQIADLQRDKRDRFAVIKSKRYNVKALRRILADRKKDVGQEAEIRDIVEHYKSLLL